MQPLNYEAHVTIEPVEGKLFEDFEKITAKYKFKPAHLLMMKMRRVTEERSNRDSFCTGHSMKFSDLEQRTEALVKELADSGFAVWRYKIEATLVDVKKERMVRIGNPPQ